MTSKKAKFYSVILLISISVVGIVFALDKTGLSPSATPSSTYHSLNDIYTLITTGATSSPNSSISTTTETTATTTRSTSEIYALLANMQVAGVAVSIPSSLTPSNSAGTAQGYTLEDIYVLATTTARGGNPTLAGTHTFGNTPASTMYTLDDIYDTVLALKERLTTGMIRLEANYFGMVGTGIYNFGEACDYNYQCLSGYCNYDDGQNFTFCGNGETGVDYCMTGEQCSDEYCDQITFLCSDGGVGTGCLSDDFCQTDLICNTYDSTCSDKSIDSSCVNNSECDSDNCDINNTWKCLAPLAITDGLVGYWPFDETSGTTANDLSSGNNDGLFSNGVAVNQDGRVGTSFGFDGTGILEIGSSLGLGTVMSVSTWVYLPETTSGSVVNIGCADTGWGCSSSGIGIGIGETNFDDPGNNFFIVNNGITWDDPITSIGTGWHHIAVVMENDTIVKQYIDGTYIKSYSYPESPFVPLDGSDTIKIGGYFGDYTRLFTGKIDELAIWNRALSQQEITNLYNGGAGMSIITP